MNPASEHRTLEELVADLESCAIGDFFNQNFVDNPIGAWDLHRNDNQALLIDGITPIVPPDGLTPGLTPPHDFIQHQLALNEIISYMVNTRLSSYVEAYLARLQAVHGQQLTVGQAMLILKHHLPSTNLHNVHFGHSAFPLIPFVPPVEVAPAPPDIVMTEPGTSAGTPVEVPAVLDTEGPLEACDMGSLRRIFSDGDRVKVECLWPDCGRTMMKDNHPRHIRECHLRAKRGVVRKNNTFRNSVG